MLICDLCGGSTNVLPTIFEFGLKRKDDKPTHTTDIYDVCKVCNEKINNMLHTSNNLSLSSVLSKGLDLKQKVYREPIVSNRVD